MSARAPRWLDGIVVVLLAGIGYASLARRGQIDCTGWTASWLRESLEISGGDALGNVFAYLLLGAALGFAWRLRRPRHLATPRVVGLAVIGGCMVLSLTMETAQACMTDRTSSVWDVLTNTLGAALGWYGALVVAPAWSAILGRDRGGPGHGRPLAVVLLAAAAWAASQTAPWVPSPSLATLRTNLAVALAALDTGYLDPWLMAAHGGEWIALAGAFALALNRPASPFVALTALAGCMFSVRLLLPEGTVPAPELLATLPAGLLAALLAPRTGRRTRAALVLCAAAVAIAAAQLEPGNGPTLPFRWRAMLLHGSAIDGIEGAAYFGWVAMTVVVAGHALGGRVAAWALLPGGLLALLSWAQTGVPGRAPELSPMLIALACAALAAGMLGDARSRRGR
jgi:VanZ family protein